MPCMACWCIGHMPLEGCLEGSEEEAELKRIVNAIEAYEAVRWPSGRIQEGKASKPGQSRTRWGHSAPERSRNREDNSASVVDHDGSGGYSGPLHRKREAVWWHSFQWRRGSTTCHS
jgi:hypothetical protein